MPVLKPMVIDGPVTLLPDLHVPYHNAPFLNKMLELSRAWAIPTCVVTGDLFQFDAFSKFVRHPAIDTKQELAVCEKVLTVLCDTFEKVILLEGNHDWRLSKRLDQEIPNAKLQRIFSLADNFTFSDYSVCYHKAGWKIGHPNAFRKARVALPRELADNDLLNVASCHTHGWGHTRSYNGRYYAVDLGHCCDPDRLEYVVHQWKPMPKWWLGAMILNRGLDNKWHHYLLDENADWKAMSKLYAS